MPNMTKMEKKKRTARKSMIQLKSAEDVMNLFEDVAIGPIEIAPIKGEKVTVDLNIFHFQLLNNSKKYKSNQVIHDWGEPWSSGKTLD